MNQLLQWPHYDVTEMMVNVIRIIPIGFSKPAIFSSVNYCTSFRSIVAVYHTIYVYVYIYMINYIDIMSIETQFRWCGHTHRIHTLYSIHTFSQIDRWIDGWIDRYNAIINIYIYIHKNNYPEDITTLPQFRAPRQTWRPKKTWTIPQLRWSRSGTWLGDWSKNQETPTKTRRSWVENGGYHDYLLIDILICASYIIYICIL